MVTQKWSSGCGGNEVIGTLRLTNASNYEADTRIMVRESSSRELDCSKIIQKSHSSSFLQGNELRSGCRAQPSVHPFLLSFQNEPISDSLAPVMLHHAVASFQP